MRRLVFIIFVATLATAVHSQNLINIKQWKAADGGNDHWYAQLDDMAYWDDALYLAGTLDAPVASGLTSKGYLATVLSDAENTFIMQNVVSGRGGVWSDQFWIGGFLSAGGWTWTTNEPMNYTNWLLGEPNNMGRETAIALWGPSLAYKGQWNNSFNGDAWALHMKQRAIIEWGALDSATLITPTQPPLCCMRQWRAADGGNNHWYAVLTQELTWEEAAASVFQMSHIPQPGTQHQPYLASINSASENLFVMNNLLRGSSPDYALWLGGRHGHFHDITGEGRREWMWTSHEPFYTSLWTPGENYYGAATLLIDKGGVGNGQSAPGDWLSTSFYRRFWSVIEWGNLYCGDVDDSKRVNVADITQFFKWVSAKGPILAPKNADTTGDGAVNIADAVKLVDFVFRNGDLLACIEW